MGNYYWDHAATTPPFPELLDPAYLASLPWGNPSSAHALGLAARRALDEARDQVRRALGAKGGAVIATSGGTEANRIALLGLAKGPPRPGNVVLNGVEHPSVRNLADWIEALHVEVRWAPVDAAGRVSPEAVAALVDKGTLLVSVQTVNNELGTLQPVAAIAAAARGKKRNVRVHTDAVQALGKVDLDVEGWGVDLVSVSAHKVHGPKGVGALWVRDPRWLVPYVGGGSQEEGLRPGTQNVPGFLAFGRAIELYRQRAPEGLARMRALRDAFRAQATARIPGLEINGGADVAPHILSLNVPGVRAELLLHALDARGVRVSAGSACRAGQTGPTQTLQAVGITEERGTIRLSWGLTSDPAEVGPVVDALAAAVAELREVK